MTDTFDQRLLLLVLDKLVFAAVLACAVLFGQRWLERYKARQTLVAGLMKLQIDAIAKLCEELGKVEDELFDIDSRYYAILRDVARAVGAQPGADFTIAFPRGVHTVASPELGPRLDKVYNDLKKFGAIASQPTFWIPPTIAELLRQHSESLAVVCGLLRERVKDRKYVPPADLESSTTLAGRKRLTLDAVLARISTGASTLSSS